MPVGLFPRETSDLLAVQPDQGTTPPEQPGAFSGFHPIDDVAQGLAEGGAKVLEAGETAVATGAQKLLSPLFARQFDVGRMGGAVPETPPIAEDPEVSKRHAETAARAVVQQFQLDPHTAGAAAQTLHGLVSGVARFGAGSVFGGPVGGAVTVGGTEGVDTANALKDQGVDENTANALGAANALFAGGASLLPGGYGKSLIERLATGAGANTLSGFTQRGLTHNVLADAGYTAQAQQYQALDGSAMMADAVLGTAFGAMHHVFTPSVIDAAHVVADADYVETSTPGGAVPTTPGARDAHVANMTAAAEALLRGDDMPPLRDVEMVPNPAAARAGEARTAAVEEAAREATGEPVARPEAPIVAFRREASSIESGLPPVAEGFTRLWRGNRIGEIGSAQAFTNDLPGIALPFRNFYKGELSYVDVPTESLNENKVGAAPGAEFFVTPEDAARAQRVPDRRADQRELARLQELRAKRTDGTLTAAEKDELLTLQERDRLASKVGGRRIQGVQTDEAYAEMLGRGEALPVQGFVDMDMLKALNDTLGHGAGDDAIRTLGESLSRVFGEGNAFRRSSSGAGDEFLVQASDQARYDAAIAAARQHLANHTIRAFDAQGNLIGEQKGIGFSHGSGKTVELAEQAAYADKQLRKEQGLRTDRPTDAGGVPAKPAATGGAGGSAQTARPKAGTKVSAARATTELSDALRELAADPTNQSAHTAVRAALKAIEDSGLDADSVQRAAVERGGEGADKALATALRSDRAAVDSSAFDAPTREVVDQAQAILERRGDEPIAVTDEVSGATLPAREALTRAVDDLKNAQSDGELARVAAACFGRG